MNYYFTTKNQSKIKALLILFAVICCCATSFAQWNTWCYKDFTTTGSQTFTLPANCDGIVVEAIGGGGAGGAAVIDGGVVSFHFASAGGGGGAAYARQISHQNTNMAGQTLTIYVGKGGTSLTNGTITNGEASYVKFGSTTLVKAVGGNSAAGRFSIYRDGFFDTNVETTPGANGGQKSDCTGSTCYSGGNGSVGADTRERGSGSDGNRIRGGAGGGAAGGNGNGGDGYINIAEKNETQPTGGTGGAGNASGLISGVNWLTGGAGANGTYGGNGWESEIAGNNYGGGGAGTRVQETNSNNSHNGSAGAQGIVRVWFHISKNDVQLAVNPASAEIIAGTTLSIEATGSNLIGTPSYSWSTGDNTNVINVMPGTSTNYTVTLTDTYIPGCAATLTKEVPVTVNSATLTLDCPTGTGNCYSFPEAAFNGVARTIQVNYTEDPENCNITLPTLPAGWESEPTKDGDNNIAWFVSVPETATAGEVQNFIRGISFCVPSGAMKDVTIVVDASNTPSRVFYCSETQHYYQYVQFADTANHTATNPDYNKTWMDCYNAAKGMTYLGRQGYLATLTSLEEDKYVTRMIQAPAWVGATRLGNTGNAGAMYYASFNAADEEQTTNHPYWYWACGPEKGTTLLNTVSYPSGQSTTTLYENQGVYSNWAVHEPSSKPDGQGSAYESCLTILRISGTYTGWQAHTPNFAWNDKAYAVNYVNTQSEWSSQGYLVEFGDQTIGNSTPDQFTFAVQANGKVGAFNPGLLAGTETITVGETPSVVAAVVEAEGLQAPISYKWFCNGTEISGATASTYDPADYASTPGTYIFTRQSKDACSDSYVNTNGGDTLNVVIPVVIDTIQGNTAICAGDSTTLTAVVTVSQGTVSYKWSNDATTAATTVKAAGDYTVTATVTVGDVTNTDTKTIHVTVYDIPTFTISTTPESCAGDDGTASVSLSDVLYKWSNDEETQEIEGLAAGEYVVTVTDLNGCKNTDTAKITLNNTLNVSPVTGPTVCTGNEFTIFPEASAGTTYSWPAPAPITGISGLEGLNDQPSVHGILTIDPAIITSPTAVSYTVTPKLGKCTGNAMGVTVTVTTTVSPEVTVTIAPTMTKCASTEVQIPVEFVNGSETHDIKWVLMGTTDTISKTGVTSMKDTLNVTLPSTCSAQYTYQVFYVGTGGCVANDGCVITVNSGTWSIPQNDTVTVACVSDAQTRPANADLTPVNDGCGNPTTPNYVVSAVTYESGLVTKVDHKYRYTACDGTYKVWHCVKIINNAAPVLTCESNQSVNTDAGKNYATLTFAAPQATDDCGTPTVAVTYSPATPTNATTTNASGQYPIGTTTVTYTATDDRNNTESCSFTVTVADNEAPVITAPADIEVDNYNDVPAPFTTLDEFIAGGGTATDNSGIDPTSFHYTNVSDGNKCPETFTRTYYISDVKGNESFDVQLVVVNDNIAPIFAAPADVTICRNTADGSFDARTTITGIPNPDTFSDNNTPVANLRTQYVDLDILPENDNEMRVLRREWRVLDECDNYTPQIQNINIYPAITAEKANFSCPADINAILPFGQCEMEINIGEATYGEFFGQTLTLTNNAPADNIYPEGTTTVTWTLTDECGFSVSCDQTITVTFPECPLAVDADGNEYESVRIGCDCWTKRNLESLTYSDGTEIPGVYNYVSDVYPNEAENVANFGRLYDWASVIKDGADNEYGHVQGICPEGWYLPTAEKFAELSTYGADALKSPDFWLDGGGSNTTGFTSLPGGYYDGSIDRYMNLMGEAYYWSASKVDDEWTPVPCNIRYICNQVIGADYMEGLGYSVRCIKEKDVESTESTFTCGTSTVKDVDNNTYHTVKIGDQCWMK